MPWGLLQAGIKQNSWHIRIKEIQAIEYTKVPKKTGFYSFDNAVTYLWAFYGPVENMLAGTKTMLDTKYDIYSDIA